MTQKPTSPFYKRLQTVLSKKGMAPKQLSDATGINHSVISRWRNLEGDKLPLSKSLGKICMATGARIEYLTSGELPMFKEVFTNDLESLAMVWEDLPDGVKNKIFRLAGTYPFAHEAVNHGAENSDERATWIAKKAAVSFQLKTLDNVSTEMFNGYVAGRIPEDEYYW